MATDQPTIAQLLKDAASTEGNVCHVCDTQAHYRITLGGTGKWACVEHVQSVIEAVVRLVTGKQIVVDPASYYEREQRKGSRVVGKEPTPT